MPPWAPPWQHIRAKGGWRGRRLGRWRWHRGAGRFWGVQLCCGAEQGSGVSPEDLEGSLPIPAGAGGPGKDCREQRSPCRGGHLRSTPMVAPPSYPGTHPWPPHPLPPPPWQVLGPPLPSPPSTLPHSHLSYPDPHLPPTPPAQPSASRMRASQRAQRAGGIPGSESWRGVDPRSLRAGTTLVLCLLPGRHPLQRKGLPQGQPLLAAFRALFWQVAPADAWIGSLWSPELAPVPWLGGSATEKVAEAGCPVLTPNMCSP